MTVMSGEDGLEKELLDSIRPDIEKWIDESKLSVLNITFAKTGDVSPDNQGEDVGGEGLQGIEEGVAKVGLGEVSPVAGFATRAEEQRSEVGLGSDVVYQVRVQPVCRVQILLD